VHSSSWSQAIPASYNFLAAGQACRLGQVRRHDPDHKMLGCVEHEKSPSSRYPGLRISYLMPAALYSSYIVLASAFVKRPSCLTCRISLIVKFMLCLLLCDFLPVATKG
jgi:hypothetical protein